MLNLIKLFFLKKSQAGFGLLGSIEVSSTIHRKDKIRGRTELNSSIDSLLDQKDPWRIFRIISEFVEGFDALNAIGPAVSIFGSARILPNSPIYQMGEDLGKLLVEAGYTVLTGGGNGVMEAVNKGAFLQGGHSIGLNIALPEKKIQKLYQTRMLRFRFFFCLKVMFVKYATAFVVFPGGFGTLDEFFEVLTLIQTNKINSRPLILLGSEHWKGLMDWIQSHLYSNHYIGKNDLSLIQLVDSPKEAVKLIVDYNQRKGYP